MIDSNVPQDLQDEIQSIRNKYKERLLSDKLKLTALLDGLTISNLPVKAKDMHNILHSITGSAGTFGFHEITNESRRIDRALQEFLSLQSKHASQALIEFVNREVPHFCQLLTTNDFKSTSTSNKSKRPEKNGSSEDAISEDIWLIEEDEHLATQFSKQLINFNFKIKALSLETALQLADTRGWPTATIFDVDFDSFGDSSDFSTLFTSFKELPKGLLILSENDAFEQRIKAAKLRATSFLKKPIIFSELIRQLEATVDSKNSAQPRVMLIDDDRELCALMKLELESEGMLVNILHDVNNIVTELNDVRPDLVLLDMEMPDYSGIDIALLIRQHVQYESLPIVYLSAETNIDKQSEALLFDADDFLVKPISRERLISSIRSRVQRARNLEQLISKDGLTGLLKHSAIKEHAERELTRARREKISLSTVMLDIDFFKRVNDTYGHSTGDTVIASLATLLRHRLRQSDIIGRYGGEEFMIILPNTSESEAFVIVDGIRKAFSEMEFFAGSQTFYCTLSAGCVSSKDFSDEVNASQLVEAADKALYVSKENGRNRVSKNSDL